MISHQVPFFLYKVGGYMYMYIKKNKYIKRNKTFLVSRLQKMARDMLLVDVLFVYIYILIRQSLRIP